MTIAKKKKIICCDCKQKIEIEGKEIKNGVMLNYLNGADKITVFKCHECFKESQELKNYQPCEVYSRVVGYLRPVSQWNIGKQQEYKERKTFKLKKD
jgi:hypothetical protein